MPWVGGKAQLMWAIQMLLPTHYKTLVDVFGGSGIITLSLYTTDMLMNMDWDLLGVVNPILDGATGIRLQDGASCDILLPFDLYRYRFTSSEWNGLEQSSIWLQVTNYPTRKIIQVNIGEE